MVLCKFSKTLIYSLNHLTTIEHPSYKVGSRFFRSLFLSKKKLTLQKQFTVSLIVFCNVWFC